MNGTEEQTTASTLSPELVRLAAHVVFAETLNETMQTAAAAARRDQSK